MSKFPIYIILLTIVLFTACLKGEEDLFPDSPAVRINKTIQDIESTLCAVKNGWAMEYFATDESPGYTMLISFDKNGEVVVAAKNNLLKNKYIEDKSVFDVIGDNGPVLTFNTFNNVLHLFSTPENPDGEGLAGDYEFMVISYTDTLVQLKGKKRGTAITLKQLPQNVTWLDYFSALEKMDSGLFGSGALFFISGKDTLIASNGALHIFELFEPKTSDSKSIPFIVTIDGIKFNSEYITKSDIGVRSFILSDDGNRLISTNDKDTYFVGYDNSSFLINSHETFVFDTERMSDHFLYPYNTFSEQMTERYDGQRNLDVVALSYDSKIGHSFYFSTKPKESKANFKIEFQAYVNNTNLVTIKKIDGVYDSNGELFLSKVPAIYDFWTQLEGTYTLSSTLSKKEIKFIDTKNESRYFVVIKK